ncbi:MAG: [protein-PII] uridylyltransferase [Brachymonas sp.]
MQVSDFSARKNQLWASLPAQALDAPSLQTLQSAYAHLLDDFLQQQWQRFAQLQAHGCLCAVGGYGRAELYPHSDVDVLCLLPADASEAVQQDWEAFFSACWDAGLCLASSVRNPEQCVQEAVADLTVQTTLLEMRHLAGARDLGLQMQSALRQQSDAALFWQAKQSEQDLRHAKHGHSAYALEPNCKESPGGLRDMHLLHWGMRLPTDAAPEQAFWQVAQQCELLDVQQAQSLAASWAFVASVRCHLHLLAQRGEDRLLFDWQIPLAQAMGYTHVQEASSGAIYTRSASAALMRDYYAAVKHGRQLLEIARLRLDARLAAQPCVSEPLDEDFAICAQRLQLRGPADFVHQPQLLWRAFAHYQAMPALKGFDADMLCSYYQVQAQLPDALRAGSGSHAAFLQILQAPRGMTRVLRYMNALSFLQCYLPAFAPIVGQTQHDLMHAYTVDQHILLVLANVRRFFLPEFASELPECTRVAADLEQPWVLWLAALFHDIAKGRGGDHSSLGAQDAADFAAAAGLAAQDADLLVFLVREHLLLSQVAQKQDLSDPQVIADFAARMPSVRHLSALYLFTVADIRGTNPKLWSDWKGQLFSTLYRYSLRLLRGQGLDEAGVVTQRQAQASQELARLALPHQAQTAFWASVDAQYFLRFEAAEIAWHTRVLSKLMAQHPYFRTAAPAAQEHPPAWVFARPAPRGQGLQVLVYARDQQDLFARICAFFDRVSLSVMEAKIYTAPNGWVLDSFELVTHEMPEHYRELLSMIEAELAQALQARQPLPVPRQGRLSRRVRHFPMRPLLKLQALPGNIAGGAANSAAMQLDLACADRVGLLYSIARVLAAQAVNLQSAKIVTLGERVEDRFVLHAPQLQEPGAQEGLLAALQAAIEVS